VLLADDLMVGEPPVLAQMTACFAEQGASVLAVQEIPPEHSRRYGVVAGHFLADNLMAIDRIVEKPAPEQAPSNWGVAGRYVLTPEVFQQIRQQSRGVGGEIQLTDGIAGLLASQRVLAYRYAGRRYDCGSKEGFLEATVDLAMQRADLAPTLLETLRRWC